MASRNEVRIYGRPNRTALCSQRDVMRRAVTAHTDGSFMLLALDGAGPHVPVDIPKVDEAVEATLARRCEQNGESGGELA